MSRLLDRPSKQERHEPWMTLPDTFDGAGFKIGAPNRNRQSPGLWIRAFAGITNSILSEGERTA